MKLNLDIICDYLPKDYQVKQFGSNKRTALLPRPLLYDGTARPERNTLYVVQSDALPAASVLRGAVWVCVGENFTHDCTSFETPVLFVSNAPGIFSVYNELQKIYDKFESWENKLRDELEQEESFDIRRIIEIGSMMLENNIYVSNQLLEIFYSSEIVSQPNGPIRVSVSDVLIHPTMKIMEHVRELLKKESATEVPYLSSVRWEGSRMYSYNLYPLGHYVGTVFVVEKYRPFRQSDFSIADRFFFYFQLAFQKHLRSFRPESADVTALHSLFHGEPLSEIEQKQFLLQPGERWICFKVRERNGKRLVYLPRDIICAIIRALMPKTAYTAIHNDTITGLLRIQDEKSETSAGATVALQEIIRRMGYIGGFSSATTDLSKIKDCLLQANYAMELRMQGGQTEPMCFFNDHILQYMISECTCHLPPESLYSRGLLALIEHDSLRGTNYMDTLDIYLSNEMNITRTAESLHLHRTSVIKRLNRIEQQLGESLNDSDVCLYYRICLYLWKRNRVRETAE